ncbi:hypothetical protein [Alteriqipengyuania lutimaris]|uniref:hypothetical protein n=1 Tax=Alteriqipengyuania lutimaris TaxID=1538146 RepID=UPI0017CD4463|nr:hypothetical protein [Alteriqipengyuania lutimaris]MBB3035525.1 hypothetical protein [Alteriqipengyuania lutimaris]
MEKAPVPISTVRGVAIIFELENLNRLRQAFAPAATPAKDESRPPRLALLKPRC